MICMLDMFKNCLILRHRRSHDITVPSASTKNVFNLTRSSSTTSIISCTTKQDDLPPLGTLPRVPCHIDPARPASFNSSSSPKILTELPARPNSIAGLPSIAEGPSVEPVEKVVTTANAVTIIEVNPLRKSPRPAGVSLRSEQSSFEEENNKSSEKGDSESVIAESISGDNSDDEYPYQDIYEEIRHRDSREDDLPDVVTSAYASGEQVYQELLNLVKEEEIKDEKRRSQLLCVAENSDESVTTSERSDDGSDCSEDKKNSLEDLYAVPKRNRTTGPRLPPRRAQSNYSRDPNWAPKVPEKSIQLRRSLSDVCGPNDQMMELSDKLNAQKNLAAIEESTKNLNDIYEELHVRRDRLI